MSSKSFRERCWLFVRRHSIWIFTGLFLLVMLWPVHRYEFRSRQVVEAELARHLSGNEMSLESVVVFKRMTGTIVSGNLKARVSVDSFQSAAGAEKCGLVLPRDGEVYPVIREDWSRAYFRRHNLVARIEVAGPGGWAERDVLALEVAEELNEFLRKKKGLMIRLDTFGNRLWEERVKPSLPGGLDRNRKKLSRAIDEWIDGL